MFNIISSDCVDDVAVGRVWGDMFLYFVYNFLDSKHSFFASLINNSTYTNHFIIYTQIHLHAYKPIL